MYAISVAPTFGQNANAATIAAALGVPKALVVAFRELHAGGQYTIVDPVLDLELGYEQDEDDWDW